MKPTRAVLRCVILMLLVSLGISIASAFSYNRYLEKNFVPNGKKWPMFEQGIPIEDIYNEYLDSTYYAFSNLTSFSIDIVLNHPIRYYHTPNINSEPAVELPEGRYRIEIGEPVFHQGINTLPTYQEGWRYARTLPEPLTLENEKQERFTSPMRWYYVRLEDLKRVKVQLQLGAQRLYIKFFLKGKRRPPASLERQLEYGVSLNNLDRILYENGDYLSPDLFKPLWDWKCTALVIGIVLLMIPERLLARREKTVRIGKSNQKAL